MTINALTWVLSATHLLAAVVFALLLRAVRRWRRERAEIVREHIAWHEERAKRWHEWAELYREHGRPADALTVRGYAAESLAMADRWRRA